MKKIPNNTYVYRVRKILQKILQNSRKLKNAPIF